MTTSELEKEMDDWFERYPWMALLIFIGSLAFGIVVSYYTGIPSLFTILSFGVIFFGASHYVRKIIAWWKLRER